MIKKVTKDNKADYKLEYQQQLINNKCIICDKQIEYKDSDLTKWVRSNKMFIKQCCSAKCNGFFSKKRFDDNILNYKKQQQLIN